MTPSKGILPKRKKRRGKKNIFILFFLFLIMITIGFSWKVTQEITKPPIKPIKDNPSRYGLEYDSVHFRSRDPKISLSGWLIYPQNSVGKTIIFTHGYGENREENASLKLAQYFSSEGYQILLFDLRDSGESQGTKVTLGEKEKKDVLGAIDYIKQKEDGDIILYGTGTGANADLLAASENPHVSGVVAIQATSGPDMYLKEKMGQWTHLPDTPFTPIILDLFPIFTGIDIKNASPDRVFRQIKCPVLLVQDQISAAFMKKIPKSFTTLKESKKTNDHLLRFFSSL